MRFNVWFRQWVRAFFKLLTAATPKYKSESQRQKEKQRRKQTKHSAIDRYLTKKKRPNRRSSQSAQNNRIITSLLKFAALSLGILLLPFGLLDWGRKSAKARKNSKGISSAGRTTRSASSEPTPTVKQSDKKRVVTKTSPRPKSVRQEPQSSDKQRNINIAVSDFTYRQKSTAPSPTPRNESIDTAPNESIPLSTPKHKGDQYIRKRMVIAQTCCDKNSLDSLAVGTYFDLLPKADDPCDKNAVELLYNGESIGYVAEKDRLAFAACFRLKRNVYGVITAITQENGQTECEYETWIDNAT